MADLDLATYGWLRAQGVPHTEAMASAKKAKDAPKKQAPVIRAATGRERVLGALQDLMAGNIVPDADTATPVPPARPAGLLGGPAATMRATTGRERVLDRVRDLYTAVGTSPLGKLADALGVSDFAGIEEEFTNPEPQVSMGMPGPPAGKLTGKARQLSQRAEHAAAEIAAGRTGTIRVGDRTVPVVRSRVAKGSGEQLVPVDVAKFDKAWSGDTGFHIDPSGSNEIGRRREGVREFLQTGEPLHAPEVTVREDGTVVFTDGRHRFAVLRDEGVPQMPVAMSAESRANAQRHGLVASEAAPAPTIRAYHGSPHDFDQFDLGKIGTGEGAAAYGHGLYFAENEGVARGYREKLAEGKVSLYGQEYSVPSWGAGMDPHTRLVRRLADNRAGRAEAKEADIIALTRQQIEEGLANPFGDKAALQRELELLERAQAHPAGIATDPGGKMYEVGIKADPEQFLDWDAPLGAQPPPVQALAGERFAPVVPQDGLQLAGGGRLRVVEDPDFGPRYFLTMGGSEFRLSKDDVAKLLPQQGTGSALYQRLATDLGGDPAATEALRKAGVPGLKYLDQGSRTTVGGELIDVTKLPSGWHSKIRMNRPNGEQYITTSAPHATREAAEEWAKKQIAKQGTRNYVLFDDKLIDILRKYGWLPPVVGAGAAAQQDR